VAIQKKYILLDRHAPPALAKTTEGVEWAGFYPSPFLFIEFLVF